MISTLQCCLLCLGDSDTPVCAACSLDLPASGGGCPQCGDLTPQDARCGRCLKTPPSFDRVLASFRYDFPAGHLLQSLKYGGALLLAPWFAEKLAPICAERSFDRVYATPLHPERLAERGFNQALEIARPLAHRLRLPAPGKQLIRTRATPAQARLPLDARQKNMRGAFFHEGRIDGAHVLLIDDVMTTGATMDACAHALKTAGAREVTVAVVARAVKSH